MIWHFIGVYIINRTLHDRLEIRNFSSRVEKYFTRSLRSLVKYFSTLEEKFRISARPCNILYLFTVCIIFILQLVSLLGVFKSGQKLTCLERRHTKCSIMTVNSPSAASRTLNETGFNSLSPEIIHSTSGQLKRLD